MVYGKGIREIIAKVKEDLRLYNEKKAREIVRNAGEGEWVYVCAQGNKFKVKVCAKSIMKGGGGRGAVHGFSRESRRRLLEKVAEIDFKAMTKRTAAIFITLTYPAQWPDMKTSKRHLKAFLERIDRRFDIFNDKGEKTRGVTGIWRVDYQKRGAPHYHFVFWNLPFWHKEEVERIWQEIIGARAFTRIEMVDSYKKALHYVAKVIAYVAKEDKKPSPVRGEGSAGRDPRPGEGPGAFGSEADGGFNNVAYQHDDTSPQPIGAPDYPESMDMPEGYVYNETSEQIEKIVENEPWQGRIWGIIGRKFLLMGEFEHVKLEMGQWFYDLKRCARQVYTGIITGQASARYGFTLFVEDPYQWISLAIKQSLGKDTKTYY